MSLGLSEITIGGSDTDVDSFAACIAAAVKYWGRDYEYDFIAGLSGSVFSPVWFESEDCMAWWMEFGNDTRVRFLGKALGFSVRESPEMSKEDYESTDELSKELAEFWKDVEVAIEEGEVVLMQTWPVWSIITEWNDDVTKLGLASLSGLGGRFCPPCPLAKLYILTPGPVTLTRADAMKEAVKFGADIADGSYKIPGFSYGGKLYGAILERMNHEYFCDPCAEKGWSCAVRTMARVTSTNRRGAAFMRFAGEFLGERLPKPAVDEVAAAFERIAGIAEIFTDAEVVSENWENDEFRSRFVSEVKKLERTHGEMSEILRGMVEGI